MEWNSQPNDNAIQFQQVVWNQRKNENRSNIYLYIASTADLRRANNDDDRDDADDAIGQ